jgi:hypothetical protein
MYAPDRAEEYAKRARAMLMRVKALDGVRIVMLRD